MSSKMRPETKTSTGTAMPYDTALFLIKRSVATRRRLIHGRLNADGEHCAMGAFWADHPGVPLNCALIDEVAAVNDSVPPSASARERWKTVNSWLRFKLATLTKIAAKKHAK